MPGRILIIQGHPDPRTIHFGHVLADAYGKAAKEAGHEVRCIRVADLDFPVLRTKEDWEDGEPVPAIRASQDLINWAEHLVIFYPLWHGDMPALFKAFVEQVFRPGFAVNIREPGKLWEKLLKHKSARIVITMGMPAFIYHWYFREHSLKSLKRNILAFSGIGPIHASLIGMVDDNPRARQRWIAKMTALGQKGE